MGTFKGSQMVAMILKKKNNMGGFKYPDFKSYRRAKRIE